MGYYHRICDCSCNHAIKGDYTSSQELGRAALTTIALYSGAFILQNIADGFANRINHRLQNLSEEFKEKINLKYAMIE